MSKPDRKVHVVVTKNLHVGETLHVPPPDDRLDRVDTYAFLFPLRAALTLAKNGAMRPAHPNDARIMASKGVNLAPFYAVDKRAPIAGLDDVEDEDGFEIELIKAALEDGRKAALVEALELVGEDPSKYANNKARRAALEAHI